MLLMSPASFFSKLTFSKNSFRTTIGVSNDLDTDQGRHSVDPDLVPKLFAKVINRQQKSELAHFINDEPNHENRKHLA